MEIHVETISLERKKPRRSTFAKRALLISVALIAGAGIVSALTIVVDGLTDEVGPADVAVVLGNKVERDGEPSDRLRARLDKAAELYRQGLFPTIIVSGGLGREGYNEAEVMQRYLVGQGIPEGTIVVDRRGNNTYLTARHAARTMQADGLQRVMVITHYFHVPRAKMALRRFGVPEVYAAHAACWELRDLYAIAREVVAFYAYLVRDYH